MSKPIKIIQYHYEALGAKSNEWTVYLNPDGTIYFEGKNSSHRSYPISYLESIFDVDGDIIQVTYHINNLDQSAVDH